MAPRYSCHAVTLYERVGSGAFGDVYLGHLDGEGYVAIKIVKGSNYDSIKEIIRMRHLDHPNVISLLGTVPPHLHSGCSCDDSHSNWLIMEYMPKGNLHTYLKVYPGGIPAFGMIKIAYQVAVGMDYLHRFANVVHRDLAARNVLVKDDNFNVKIGDFGISADYDDYGDTYYEDKEGKVFPIRWTPPENMPDYNGDSAGFSRKGDVWSFGVLLFEIWTRGALPFADINDNGVMHAVKKGSTVLDYHNVNARYWVLNLMKECFEYNKEDRPNFRKIYLTIKEHSEYALDD